MSEPPPRPRFGRVVLKISGETFRRGEVGIDPEALRLIAAQIVEAAECCELAVVVGGGNLIRGGELSARSHIHRATADAMGMLATVINGMALKEALEAQGMAARLMSAIDIPVVAERFIRARALRHFQKQRVVILAAGTGNPFFTTDTCAALRAVELSADVLLKATKVDGVYSADPTVHADAKRYDWLSFDTALDAGLRVMDLTALTMCKEHKLPVIVFDFKVPGNIRRAAAGETVGTLLTESTVRGGTWSGSKS